MAWWRRTEYERELDAEMEHHIAARADDLEREGLSPDEARRQASREFGPKETAKDYCRDQDGWRLFDELRRNLVFAVRRARARPGMVAAVVATLAICIGANLMIFGVVDAVLLQPVPYPEPEELRLVRWHGEDPTQLRDAVDGTMWFALEESVSSLRLSVVSFGTQGVNFVPSGSAGGAQASLVDQARVGRNYFEVMGVPPARGRGFTAEEDLPEGPAVVVISWDLWHTEFAGKEDALGQSVLLAGEPHTVVGVAAPGFDPRSEAAVWVPLRPSTGGEGSGTNYQVLARPASGAEPARVVAELAGVSERVSEERGQEVEFVTTSLQAAEVESLRSSLLLLWGAVVLVLLIGCVNVAGLLLSAGAERVPEIATRRALGGGTGAIVRQLLTESFLLGLLGALGGLVLAHFGLGWLGAFARQTLGLWQEVGLDVRMTLFAVLLGLLATATFGLAPAWMLAKSSASTLRTRGVTRSSRLRQVLVAAQVALGVALLLTAGLLVRTLVHLGGEDAGVQLDGMLAATVSLRDARFEEAAAVRSYFEEGLGRLRERPEVAEAGVVLSLPFERGLNMPLRLPDSDEPKLSVVNYVVPGTLEALGLPLLAGRHLAETDAADAPPVALVSRTFVERYLPEGAFPGGAPGTRFELDGQSLEVVGVVEDMRQRPSFSATAPLATDVPTVYVPAAQLGERFFRLVHTWFRPDWVVRTVGPQGAARRALSETLEATDPLTPVARIRDLREERRSALRFERFLAVLFSGLAAVALILAAVGVAGVSSGSVAERRKELGIRVALGATVSSAVMRAALPGMTMVLVGLAVGIGLAQLARTGVQSLLYGVGFHDPLTNALAIALLLLVAGLASLIPALKVTRLPVVATLQEDG